MGPNQAGVYNRKHLQDSVNFGNHPNDYVSEAKSQYLGLGNEGNDPNRKAIIDKNRKNHFNFNDGLGHHPMTTTHRTVHDFKGNPLHIRSTLDPEVKKDLRCHHLSMGSHGSEFEVNPQVMKVDSKYVLRKDARKMISDHSMRGLPGYYKTIYMTFIGGKWLQPHSE